MMEPSMTRRLNPDSPREKSSSRDSSSSRGSYIHESLLDGDFRILELLPGEFDDEIRCELRNEHMSLNDDDKFELSYEAISYTWGNPNDTIPIRCSGKVFKITKNLYAALKHLRRKDEVRRLWADAICIDQFNIPERNQHVQRMDCVYAGADRVLVWLGEETETVGGALEILPTWLSMYPPHVDWHAAKIRWDSVPSTFAFSSMGLSEEATKWLRYQQVCLNRMLHLFSRPWWRRKWIIQELVQAKQAVIICGRQEVDWASISEHLNVPDEKFSAWHDSLDHIYDKHPDKELTNGANDGIFHARQLVRIAAQFSGPDALSLRSLMYSTNDFKCTESRDHLFSLLAIASDVRNNPKSDLLRIDYRDSVGTISKNYCLWLLMQDNTGLSCFSIVPGSHGCCNDNPSWAPSIVPIPWKQRPDLRRPFSLLSYDAGCCERFPRPSWELSKDNLVLSIYGVITETVADLIPPPTVDITSTGWTYFDRQYATWLKSCYNVVATRVTDHKQTLDFFYYIIACGGEKARSGDGDWRSPSPEACQKWLDVVFNDNYDTPEGPNLFADLELSAMTTSISYAKFRKLCITSEGRLGWVPEGTNIGDKICILYGGKVPFVASPCGNGHYNLIGECYVHGIMDGEALEFGLSEQMIEFC